MRGVLSPPLWCLVDDLIARLNGCGIYTQAYVDDICLLAVGEIPKYGIGAQAMGPSYCKDVVQRGQVVG